MQEVFEKIIEKLEEYMDKNLVEHDSEQSQHCKDVGDCGMTDCALCVFDKAIGIVKQTVEKLATDTNVGSNGWIPCGERLPEEHDSMFARFKGTDKWNESMFEKTSNDVNVTISDEKGYKVTTHAHTTDGTWRCDILRACPSYRVIAWQPLPAPYQPHICHNNDCAFNKGRDCPAAEGCGGYECNETNGDQIRSMSDEELAEIIMCPYDTSGNPIEIMPCVRDGNVQELVPPEDCKRCIMEWLGKERR